MQEKMLPSICPSCGKLMKVHRLECMHCDTTVEGTFKLPLLARLEPDDQEFILNLLKAGGSLKEMASLYSISYPTIRNRLDSLIAKVEAMSTDDQFVEENSDGE